jgi:hypothetical protein
LGPSFFAAEYDSKKPVKLTGAVKDRTGGTARVTIDAKIQDVTSPRRSLVGTWSQGEKKGDFKAVRDN